MFRFFLPLLFTLMFGFLFSHKERNEDPYEVKSIAYPEQLTGAFTGGFGEETCRSCHFDYDLNPEGGSLSVSGIPEQISKGERFEIEISVSRENIRAGGFQLSARFKDGTQAGNFEVAQNERIMLSKFVPDTLQYVQHSEDGTIASGKGTTRWTVNWQAPTLASSDIVIFNISGNAANGDQSEFGDFIYNKEVKAEFDY